MSSATVTYHTVAVVIAAYPAMHKTILTGKKKNILSQNIEKVKAENLVYRQDRSGKNLDSYHLQTQDIDKS